MGDTVRSISDSHRTGLVAIPEVLHEWTEIVDTADRSSWIDHRREDAVIVVWDDGDEAFLEPENLELVSRPEQPIALISHEVRHIEGRLIEGDVVEDPDGRRGTIVTADNYNGDYMIDWVTEGLTSTIRRS